MTYLLIGHAAMVLHFAFFGYVVLGGFLAWKWPRALWAHVGVAAYALGIVIVDWPCVLTEVENWSRAATGRTVMEAGFIDFHITGTLYPPEHLMTSRVVIACVIALSWAGAAVARSRRNLCGVRGVQPAVDSLEKKVADASADLPSAPDPLWRRPDRSGPSVRCLRPR